MELISNLSVVPLTEFLSQARKWDTFICCSSFEERCLRSIDIFLEKEVHLKESTIFNYKETDPEDKKGDNLRKMEERLRKISDVVCTFDTESVSVPSKGIKRFLAFLKESSIEMSNRKIAIDITVFTKPYFFLLFKVLREKFHLCRFDVVYTEPERYSLETPGSGEIILTEGLDRVESIPGFEGSSQGSSDALIVLLGFEGKRALEVFQTVSPEITYAINGFPSYQPGWHRKSLEANMRFLVESRAFDHLLFAPATDPFETKIVLSEIVNQIKNDDKDMNITIAPLGTKLQAFGVLLYALENGLVKVIYPFPSTYRADYSYRYGPTWILEANIKCLRATNVNARLGRHDSIIK